METAPGRTRWVIAEGYIPGSASGEEDRRFESHETACILDLSDTDAHVRIDVHFANRDPAGPYRVTVPARRTRHVQFNDLRGPEPIPLETDCSSVIESDVPVVVQHTRLESPRSESALMSTIAYSDDRRVPRLPARKEST